MIILTISPACWKMTRTSAVCLKISSRRSFIKTQRYYNSTVVRSWIISFFTGCTQHCEAPDGSLGSITFSVIQEFGIHRTLLDYHGEFIHSNILTSCLNVQVTVVY